MTQTYRTDDGTKWGSGKGSDLTPAEVDINFWDVIQRVVTLEALPSAAAGIDHFSISGTQFYVIMTDATTLGPYDLPVATFNARGEWAPSTAYLVLDTFTINGSLYVVIFSHTSGLTFDAGANDGLGHDYYSLMIETPGSSLPTGGATEQVLQKVSGTDYNTTWGYKLPTGGTSRQYLIKQSATNQDADWDTPTASDIEFVPVTGSVLTSDNVADALEELTTTSVSADGVSYTPSTGSGLTDTTVSDALDTLGARNPVGKQTMWIPAASMTPRSTNGAAPNTVELASNRIMVRTADFDTTTQEYVQFDVAMPKSWDEGTVTFRAYWSHAATSVNFGVVFGLEAFSAPNGNALDSSFGTTIYVTDTGGVTDVGYVSDESADITIGGGSHTFPVVVVFQVCRYPAHASDTLAVDARLMGIQLYYTTDEATDA